MKATRKSKLSHEAYRKLAESLAKGASYREAAKASGCHFNSAALLKKKMKAQVSEDIKVFAKHFGIPAKLSVELYFQALSSSRKKK